MDTQARVQLQRLLEELFSVPQFLVLLRQLDSTSELPSRLRATAIAPSEFFSDAVGELERRGLARGEFFDAVRSARPARAPEIELVEQLVVAHNAVSDLSLLDQFLPVCTETFTVEYELANVEPHAAFTALQSELQGMYLPPRSLHGIEVLYRRALPFGWAYGASIQRSC